MVLAAQSEIKGELQSSHLGPPGPPALGLWVSWRSQGQEQAEGCVLQDSRTHSIATNRPGSGLEAAVNLSAISASTTWWPQRSPWAVVHRIGPVWGLWSLRTGGNWMLCSFSDDSWAGSGDPAMRPSPTEICLFCPACALVEGPILCAPWRLPGSVNWLE